jgi:hypothetical protein
MGKRQLISPLRRFDLSRIASNSRFAYVSYSTAIVATTFPKENGFTLMLHDEAK